MAARDQPSLEVILREWIRSLNDSNETSSLAPYVTLQNTATKDTSNSTSATLLADAVFTGVAVNVTEYAEITVTVNSDAVSATDGIEIQFSDDGVNDWHTGETWEYSVANSYKTWKTQRIEQFFRIKYTNGGDAQTHFHLTVILSKVAGVQWSHRIKDDISGQDDAGLVRAILAAERAGGTPDVYTNIQATSAGNLKVSVEETEGNIPINLGDSLSVDAFARLRVSEPNNRFDVEFIYDKQPLIVDEVTSGGATATHDANARDVVLDVVNATNGTTAELISHYNVPYTPGNSQLVEITGTLDNSEIGGGTAQIFHRSKVSGTVVETTYDQANWNISTEADIDWTKSQIFLIDFQSLKIGRGRFGFARNGQLVPVHQIFNDNIRAAGYWQYPTQPIRWRIYNDATYTYAELAYGDSDNAFGLRYRIAANADATMRAICATVKSEGGESISDMPGFQFSADNQTTAVTVSTTKIPILSIRPKATFNSLDNRMLVVPEAFEINVDNPVLYEIYYRPTLTGASWTSAQANSGVEYDVSASAFSGGIKVASGYVSTNRNVDKGLQGVLSRVILSLGRTGTADILSIVAVRTDVSDASALSRIDWKEIR